LHDLREAAIAEHETRVERILRILLSITYEVKNRGLRKTLKNIPEARDLEQEDGTFA
jgi:hypothetical protein